MIRGFIQKGKTVVTFPKFEEKHLQFMRKYFEYPDLQPEIFPERIIFPTYISKLQLENFYKAYCYEFGSW